jgi:hypothetical protein
MRLILEDEPETAEPAKGKKKPTVRVAKNIWGNYRGYLAGKEEYMTGSEHDAQVWLDEKMASGLYALSPSSYLKPSK